MPYRSKKTRDQRPDTAQDGLVADMVRQFADRFAFVRELVQNGIDAGATHIAVHARYFEGQATFAVRDDGEGMTRAIVEGPLLTLFRSAKDGDESKIGKYGVGFVSVFALDPDTVTVETWRGSTGWHLTLRPDHSYELMTADLAAWGASGTVVTLSKRADRQGFEGEMDAVQVALKKWCRHARLPIHFHVNVDGSAPRSTRIDSPLQVSSVVSVTETVGASTISVGPSADGSRGTFAGFYNRGLTLYETSQAMDERLKGLSVKVDSADLTHTLSRDNIRHDEAFHDAMRQVIRLVDGPLRAEIVLRLKAAAEEAGDDYPQFLWAGLNRSLRLTASDLVVPLCDETEGVLAMPVSTLRRGKEVLYATERSALTTKLADNGQPVVRAPWPVELLELLSARTSCSFHLVAAHYCLLSPLANKRKRDVRLVAAVIEGLRSAGHDVDAIRLATAKGAVLGRAAVRLDRVLEAPRLVPVADRGWFSSWRARSSLALVANHPAVEGARRLARRDVASACHLLCRYILVEEDGDIDKRASEALLAQYAEAR